MYTLHVVALDADTYITTFTIELAAGFQIDATTIEQVEKWHLGARYASADPPNGWILSAASAPIPEPRSTARFLLGGTVVAGVIRKQVLTAS